LLTKVIKHADLMNKLKVLSLCVAFNTGH
jgi:hypothetical protein